MKTLRYCLVAAMAALGGGAGAQTPEEVKAERARIADERGRVEARFATEEKACYAKFGVNDCLQEARTRRREVLSDLRRQEVSINDADRRRRAAERLGEIERRSSTARQEEAATQRAKALDGQKERENRQAEKAARRNPTGAPDLAGPEGPTRPAGKPAKLRKQPEASKTLDTKANAQAHQERLSEAQKHKAKVEKKIAGRTKPMAKPLPLPP